MTEAYIGRVSSLGPPDPLTLLPESLRRLSVADYHRMVDAEVLGPDDRVELLDGVIVEMTPQSPPHAQVIRILNGLIAKALGPEFQLGVQLPLTISDRSEPEPDLAVIAAGNFHAAHPTTAFLVIEVCRGAGKRDRVLKSYLYARAQIPEYWLVDVEREEIEVLRDPDPSTGIYRSSTVVGRAGSVTALKVPGVVIAVDALFPPG